MPTSEIIDMIMTALGTMGIGIPAVFAVLGVFYISIRIMMGISDRRAKKETEGEA